MSPRKTAQIKAEELKKSHDAAGKQLQPATRILINALHESQNELAPYFIYLLENQDHNSQRITTIESNVLYHSQVLEFFDQDIQGTKTAQQEWGFLKPKDLFQGIRDAFGRHRIAIFFVGVMASVSLALHFSK